DLSTVCRRNNDGGSCQDSPGGMNISDEAYTSNTLYFNPATQYLPWQTALAGVRPSNANYHSVSTDPSLLPGSTDLSNSPQTYYVPKNPASTSLSYLGNTANYYRFQLRDGKLVRAQIENSPGGTVGSEQALAVDNLRANRNAWARSGTNGTSTATQAPSN